MATNRVSASLAKRTTFSSAINILSEATGQNRLDDVAPQLDSTLKPYSAIPGPQELPFIGNSWRFAPIIGK